jgi:hypothetical protein
MANVIARSSKTTESSSQSILRDFATNGMRSDFATAADILLNAEVCIHAPMPSRIAENARRMRPSGFTVTANYADGTVLPGRYRERNKESLVDL